MLSLRRLFIDVLSVALLGVVPATDLNVDTFLDRALVVAIIEIALLDFLAPLTDAFVAFIAKVRSILRSSPSLLGL